LEVVILCGGKGTRLREETEFKPKPMVEIGGRPRFTAITVSKILFFAVVISIK